MMKQTIIVSENQNRRYLRRFDLSDNDNTNTDEALLILLQQPVHDFEEPEDTIEKVISDVAKSEMLRTLDFDEAKYGNLLFINWIASFDEQQADENGMPYVEIFKPNDINDTFLVVKYEFLDQFDGKIDLLIGSGKLDKLIDGRMDFINNFRNTFGRLDFRNVYAYKYAKKNGFSFRGQLDKQIIEKIQLNSYLNNF